MRPGGPTFALLLAGRRELGGVVLASLLAGALVIVQAFVVAGLVVALVERHPLAGWGWAVVVTFAARALVSAASDGLSARAATKVGGSLRHQVLAKALALGATWIAARRTGGLVALATRGVAAVEPYVTRFLPALVAAASLPVLVVIAMATQDLLSALIVVVTLPLVPLFAALVGMSTQTRAKRQWREMSTLAGHFVDVVRGLPTLVAFRRARAQTDTIREITHRHRRATLSTLRLAFASSAVLELVATISVALVAVSVGLRLASGSLDLDTALVVLLLAPEAYWPLRRVGAEFHAAAEGGATLYEVSAVLAEEQSPQGQSDVPDLSRCDIVVTDADVTYDGRTVPAVSGVTATIRPGELVAISGASGSGKSTLIAALAGQVRLTGGSIDVGGVALGDLDPAAWSAQVAWVPQRPWFDDGSIADNLRLGRADARDGDLWDALRRVQLSDVVAALPGGLSSPVGEDGTGLSAGERARLALARAIVAERPLVILDEPTAHLDAATEALVLDALTWLGRRSTVVVVAHRAAVVALADQVITVRATETPARSGGASLAGGEAPAAEQTASAPPASTQAESGRTSLTPSDTTTPNTSARSRSGSTLAWGMVLGALAAGSGVALTATAGWLIVRASEQPPVLMLLVAIIGVRTFGIARPMLRYVERLVSHDAALRTLADKRVQVYVGLIPLTPGALGRRRGDVLASVVDDVDAYVDRRLRVWAPLVSMLAVGAGAAVLAGLVLPRAAIVIVALGVAGGWGAFALSRVVVRRAEYRFVEERARLSTQVTSLLEGAADLQAWGAASDALTAADATGARLAASSTRSALGAAAGRSGQLVCLGLSVVAMGFVTRTGLAAGELSSALAALLVLTPLGLAEVLAPMPEAGAIATRTGWAIERLDTLVDDPAAIEEPARPLSLAAHGDRRVAFADVDAGWGGASVLHGLTLDLPRGRRVGVVGPSGSGKSTLAALLLRFIDPTSGTVALDGVAMTRLPSDDVRREVGLVDDSPHVFGSTLVENIRFAKPGATDSEVARALHQAQLGPWLSQLPRGLDTRLGDGGADVSGGERARLALARSLLADQPVLVLDEPAAHLDAATARDVLADLMSAARGRSVVLISHRPEGLSEVDCILDLGSRALAATRGEPQSVDR